MKKGKEKEKEKENKESARECKRETGGVCVCACVRACVRVCAGVRVCDVGATVGPVCVVSLACGTKLTGCSVSKCTGANLWTLLQTFVIMRHRNCAHQHKNP